MSLRPLAWTLLLLPAALSACEPTELNTPFVGNCDAGTSLNRWPQFEGDVPGDTSTGFNVGDTAPDFKLQDQFGEPICLWQLAGKVVLVDASALWCAPCKDIAKHTQCVADSYEGDLVYVTFVTQDTVFQPAEVEHAKQWSDTYNLGEGSLTPVIADGGKVFVQEQEWVPSYPSFLLLDENLKIVAKETGRDGERLVRDKATELLGEPTSTCTDEEDGA
ncbi:MAG: TlpA family protein disulfide reductase [Myxococcota bacterium]